MPPPAVSATRCWGCQPVRAHADLEASSADRKACRVNGLAVASPAQASHAAAGIFADRRQYADAQFRVRGEPDGLRVFGGVLWWGLAEHALRPKSLEDHLVGEPRRHRPILGAPDRPGEDRQRKHTPCQTRHNGRRDRAPDRPESPAAFAVRAGAMPSCAVAPNPKGPNPRPRNAAVPPSRAPASARCGGTGRPAPDRTTSRQPGLDNGTAMRRFARRAEGRRRTGF